MILNQEEIDKTGALFKRAESHLKSAEHLTNKIFIPAVNELRYAGFHLINYISSDGKEDDLISAQKHCKRAIYDAAEGPLLKFLGDVVSFQNDYSKVACITEVVPNYILHMNKVREARNLIAKVQPDSREEYFEIVEPHLAILSEIVDLLEMARPEINKRMRHDRTTTRILYFTLAAGVIAATFTIIGPIPISHSDTAANTSTTVANTLPANSAVPNSSK